MINKKTGRTIKAVGKLWNWFDMLREDDQYLDLHGRLTMKIYPMTTFLIILLLQIVTKEMCIEVMVTTM
jgi:hypothetical protein